MDGKIVDGYAAVLGDCAGQRGNAHLQAIRSLRHPLASQRAIQKIPETDGEIGSEYGNKPALAIGIVVEHGSVFEKSFIDAGDFAFDGRNEFGFLSVAHEDGELLALTEPLAALRQRNFVDLASEASAEIIDADAN